MEKNNILNIITKVLLCIFIVSILVFLFSYFNISNLKDIKEENNSLKAKLEEIVKTEAAIKDEYDKSFVNMENLEQDFISKYGYDYSQKELDVLEMELNTLRDKNTAIKKQIEEEIKKFKEYYSGNYYENENLEEAIAKFSSLSSISEVDYLDTNLYEYIEINNFINEAKQDGTIKYLNNLNKNDIKNDILYFASVMYSRNLYEIGNDFSNLGDNLNKTYAEIISLTEVYKNMELFGVKTGNLSYKNLLSLKENSYNLIKEYFENKGVIETLESIGENNEKLK